MTLDHGLLFFGQENALVRFTLTRAVEPLYVFAFGFVLSMRTSNPFCSSQWCQLVIAAAVETLLHSARSGNVYFGILSSLVVAWPIAAWCARCSDRWLMASAVILSVASLFKPAIGGVTIDYGPALVTAQILVAMIVQRGRVRLIWPLTANWLVCFVAIGAMDVHQIAMSATIWTLLIGHPLAVGFILGARYRVMKCRWPLTLIALYPLRFYLGHMGVLAALSSLSSLSWML